MIKAGKLMLWCLYFAGLIVLASVSARAQIPFTVSSQTQVVRSQGETEAVADIVFTASGTGSTISGTTLLIQLGPGSAVAITNNTTVSPPPVFLTGLLSGSVILGGVGGNTITIAVPGGVSFTAGNSFAVHGIRIDASQAAVAYPPGITATVTSTITTEVTILNPIVIVAAPMPALSTSGYASSGILAAASPVFSCGGQGTSGGGMLTVSAAGQIPAGTVPFHVVATENFSTAFTTAHSFASGDEDTFTSPSEVTNPTRLLVRVNNIPSGVTLYAPGIIDGPIGGVPSTSGSLRLDLIAGADANGAGGSVVSGPADADTAFTAFTPSGGSVTIVYQVTLASPSASETADIPIAVAAGQSAGLGQATASVELGPISTVNQASTTAPIPRFADQPITGPAFQLAGCSKVLLFPWVANVAGLDTGIAIANTSKDPFGTATQSGTITLNFFGANAPTSAITTPAVAAGSAYTAVLSSLAPGFEGYIIAVANFQYAEGLAFLTNGFGTAGGANSFSSYTAIDLPNPNVVGSRLDLPVLPSQSIP